MHCEPRELARLFIGERVEGGTRDHDAVVLDHDETGDLALEQFVPLMVRGGIIILDEYATPVFGGESKAVDEYFKKTLGKNAVIKKFPWHSNPSGYIEVDW